jgi:hypothetical protein
LHTNTIHDKNGVMPRRALDLSTGVKRCPKCKATKPLSEFAKSQHTLHGYQVYCRACGAKHHDKWRRKNLKHCATTQKSYRQKNPERYADYHRKKTYGLPPGEFARMLAAQEGCCAICGTSTPNGRGFQVDHCHDTKMLRGILCHSCNLGIGQFKHNPNLLVAAVTYLNKFTQT